MYMYSHSRLFAEYNPFIYRVIHINEKTRRAIKSSHFFRIQISAEDLLVVISKSGRK